MVKARYYVPFFFAVFICFSAPGYGKGVHLNVVANWEETPIIFELAEAISHLPSDALWDYLSNYPPSEPGSSPQQKLQQGFDRTQNLTTQDHHQFLLQYAVASRYYNPTIISHLSLAELEFLRFESEAAQQQCTENKPFVVLQWTSKGPLSVNENGEIIFTEPQTESEEPEQEPQYEIIEHELFSCDAALLQKNIDVLVENILHLVVTPWELAYSLPHEHQRGAIKNFVHVILYGDFTDEAFAQYQFLLDYAGDATKFTRLTYRYGQVATQEGINVSLQGYGAELALKNTEYRTIDDSSVNEATDEEIEETLDESEVIHGINFHTLIQKKPELESSLRELRKNLAESGETIRQLKRWEMTDLSLQAAFAATQSEDTWKFLTELTGNFPSLATSLATVKLPDSFRKEIEDTASKYGPGKEYGLLNGRSLRLNDLNPFELYSMIKEELELYDLLETIDIPTERIKDVMNVDLPDQGSFRLDVRSENILWLNNIEKDMAYMQWPGTLYELFKPGYPDQLRFIRKNIINTVLYVHPLSEEAFRLYPVIEMFVRGNAPLRIGFLFDRSDIQNPNLGQPRTGEPAAWNEPLADVFIATYYHLYKNAGTKAALNFLAMMAQDGIDELSLDSINDALNSIARTDLKTIYSASHREQIDQYLEETSQFSQQLGISRAGPILFLNGIPHTEYPFTNAGVTSAVKSFIREEYPTLQKFLWQRQLTDQDDIYDFLLSQDNVNVVYNKLVVQSELKYVPITSVTMPIANPRKSYRLASGLQRGLGEFLLNQLDYITGKNQPTDKLHDITHYLILDISTQQGLRTLLELAKRFETSDDSENDTRGVRFAVIQNSGCHVSKEPTKKTFEGKHCFTLYGDLLNIAGRVFSSKKYTLFINHVLSHFVINSELEASKEVDIMAEMMTHVRPGMSKKDGFRNLLGNEPWKQQVRNIHHYVLHEAFPGVFQPGRNYILTNGRVTELPVDLDYFPASGFQLLESQERQKTASLVEMIESFNFQHVIDQEPFQSIEKRLVQFRSHLHMEASSILLHRKYHMDRDIYSLELSSEMSPLPIAFEFILDPLSKSTRKLAPILSDLIETLGQSNIHIDLKFNPTPDLSELPLSSYYRYAIHTSSLEFDTEGYLQPHSATFSDLPKQFLFTLSIDSPSSWMVQSLISDYDLDNILLSDVSADFLLAEFLLKSLVIQGSTYDDAPSNPTSPRGTELLLKDYKGNVVHDTIVMANLGYFQLQANPGLWFLEIDSGRSSKVFSLSNIENENDSSPENVSSKPIFIHSFSMPYERLPLTKNPGMEDKEVLDIPAKKSKQDQTIHVFSLASGHVYERFLKIMILSVIRNTESPVKFWFVENFLSPQFKNSVEEMSRIYGFDVELISYQWPSWLHEQTEKQRIIWAYKILFLDVLFPLNVHRVIFVDADLVVRSDLRELNELDLQGAPYGYTPFCDSRQEMEGFRFWKSGFWDDHLKNIGAKYHISALYVVDLDAFRNKAIGDVLRSVYNSLSKDPNSLANLDQDLPNFTQNNIPIYSLDQSWLWCETWCSDESKKEAKAIDLCNNPLTKSPKLENAVRIVDEWTELDQEARAVSVPKEKMRTINPVHELIARNASPTYLNIKSFLQSLQFIQHENEDNENDNDAPNGSWFSQMVNEII